MTRKNALAVRLTVLMLLAASCLVQWAGISQIRKAVKGNHSLGSQSSVLVADGSLPPPPPPKLN